MDFEALVKRFSHLGMMMLETYTDDNLLMHFTISIHVGGEWCFVSYSTNEVTAIATAEEVLNEWLV